MLGKACNLNCIYCFQGQEKPLACDTEVAPEKVASYFPQDGTYNIVFFGGEPLLYFDYIAAIAEELKERNPNVSLGTITNGTLLTVAKAKRLNELGFGVGVSHDGYAFETTRRTKDFLKYNPEPYLTLKKRSISATVTAINPNFYDIWDYFEEFSQRNGTSRENINIGIVCDIDNITEQRLIINNNRDFESMLDRVFANLGQAIKRQDFTAYEFVHYLPMLRILNDRISNPENISAWCGADRYVCHIDTRGNLYHCHNSGRPNGHISREGVQPGRYNPYIGTKKCRECPAFLCCGGGCVACSPETHEAQCYVQYQQVSRMLALLEKLKDGGLAP
jgi:uncharacterized protein